MSTKLVKEADELLHSPDLDIEQCKVIANQRKEKIKILSEIDEEILGMCESNEIGYEIEVSVVIMDRILNTKQKLPKFRGQVTEWSSFCMGFIYICDPQ